MRFINPLPNKLIFLCIIILMVFKILFFILVKNDILQFYSGGASDADYYHDYAIGYTNFAVNIWPVILKYFNSIGLYSRESISYLFLFFNLLVIPVISCKLAGQKFNNNQKSFLYFFLLCLIYPTPFFFTFDVYRDVFMVFSFLIGCLVVKACLNSQSYIVFLLLFTLSIIIGFFLLALRPYLGYAFLISLFLWKIKFNKNRIIFLGFTYFLVLFIANYVGYLDILTEYRSGFEEVGGSSNLGLDFSNPLLFVPNFILSFLGQMLGLYVTNPFAVILLIIETMPFFFMLIYVVKNIKLADNFIRFLIIFFVLYASVWLIGNDNLGTAVRLRMYNYFAIYISFFYILRLKSNNLKNLKAVK